MKPGRPTSVTEMTRYSNREVAFVPMIPRDPTTHMPGTVEKIEVMRLRVSRGEDLHHPQDNISPLPVERSLPKAPYLTPIISIVIEVEDYP